MIRSNAVGRRAEIRDTVTVDKTAVQIGSGTLSVLATPHMAALMEHAAVLALADLLDDGQTSVGTRLEISHDAATPVGMEIRAEAEIVSVSENGKFVTFTVRAWDSLGPIGSGTHTRAIVNAERFLSRCNAKVIHFDPL